MNNYLSTQYRETKHKFEKFASRLQKSQERGEFHTYSRRKQNFLLSRVKKLWEKLRILEVQLKITTAGVSMAFLLMVSNVSAQDQFVLAPDKNPIKPPSISGQSPLLLDVDNDGDLDLLVGEFYNPIGFYRNTGSPTEPSFEKVPDESNPFIQIQGYGYLSVRSIIDGADIDNDGDIDLVTPSYIFRNTGSNESPEFTSEGDGWRGYGSGLGDIDGDGDLDLIQMNYYYNNIAIYQNLGNVDTFDLSQEADTVAVQNWDLENTGIDKTYVLDIDDDGDLDLLVGISQFNYDEETGSYSRYRGYKLLRNTGTIQEPAFELEDDLNNPYKDLHFDEIRLGDLDGDGDQDVIFSSEYGGGIQFFEFDADMVAENTELVPEFYDGIALPGSTIAPEFVDIDNDGDLDIFAWTYDAGNILYEMIEDGEQSVYRRSTETDFAFLDGSAYIQLPFFVDMDLDGDTDIVRLDYDEEITYTYLENTGSDDEPVYTSTPFPPFVGEEIIALPAFVDLDNDGDQDMFFTMDDPSDNVNIVKTYFYESTGSDPLEFTKRLSGSNPLGFVTGGNFTYLMEYQTPRFSDIDEDGDFDVLFAGAYGLFYFENTGTDPMTGFMNKTESGPFSNVEGGYYNTINLVDIDSDGDDDLFVHSYYGGTVFYENLGGSGVGIQVEEIGSLDVYPNPTVDELKIRLNEDIKGAIEYEVITLEGRSIENGNFVAGVDNREFMINTSSYQAGYYFIRITSEDQRYVSKFVKQ